MARAASSSAMSAFVDATDAETKVLHLLQLVGQPLLTEDVQSRLQLDIKLVLQAVQQLLDRGAVKLRNADGDGPGQIRVGLATAAEHQEQQKTRGLQPDEKLVYQIIRQAHNKGIWIKDIRQQSNIPQPQVPKILKKLESLNLVKTVKASASATKKIYMLFELRPSDELTGGTWYTNGSLDESFVEQMRTVCAKLIESKGEMSLPAITQFVADRGFTDQRLQESQIREILQTLIYDGTVCSCDAIPYSATPALAVLCHVQPADPGGSMSCEHASGSQYLEGPSLGALVAGAIAMARLALQISTFTRALA